MKNITRTLIIGIIFLMSTMVLSAQNSSFVEYKNGDLVEAEIKGFHSLDKKIKFKNLATGKKEKVASEDLERIIYYYDGDTLEFRLMTVKALNPFGKLKELKRKGWVAKLYGTNKIQGYLYCASDYTISMNSFGGTKHNTFLTSAQAIKLPSEDYVFFIGLTKVEGFGGKRTARILMNKNLKKYLKDFCPEFSDNMNKNSYEPSELEKIIDDYTAACN